MHGEQKAPVEDRGRGPRRRSGRAHPTKKVKGPKNDEKQKINRQVIGNIDLHDAIRYAMLNAANGSGSILREQQ